MERSLQIWTSSTNFPVLTPGSCSPHFGHSVAPSLHAEDPEPVAGAGWAARPQLHFPHCPLRGARGVSLLRCHWPGDSPVARRRLGVGKLACSTDTWNPDVAPVRAMHSGLSYSAFSLLPAQHGAHGAEGCSYGRRVPRHLSAGSWRSPNSLRSFTVPSRIILPSAWSC